ncbi:radical SAM protein [uncultured Desulfosarcina sp.]|uniref:B12-binding domain-containing radical SAM protein n=1 Tax=uncultured Desulfosarcina sp. TaxID=218289 RepID=UPI0029C90042|nr:radical SAM protein [uncultured Desulfosarcina sp.]
MFLIVNPPSPPGYIANKDVMGGLGQLYGPDAKTRIPPIDMVYVAACLKNNKTPFTVIDCLGDDLSLSDFLKKVGGFRPETFIAVRTSMPTFAWDLKVSEHLKEIMPEAKIIFFGSVCNIFPDDLMQYDVIDILVTGEVEVILPCLATQPIDQVEGIYYRKKGTILKNPDKAFFENLDALPFPAWEFFPYQNYFIPDLGDANPALTIQTSRGCPFNCDYCPYPLAQGNRWRSRTPENIFAEIEYLIKRHGMRSLLFRDPEFTLDQDRIHRLCDLIISSQLQFWWRCETRPDTLSENLIQKMAQAGCIGINLGIEHVNKSILARVKRKPVHPDHIVKIVQACAQNKIATFCFFIIGLPGETISTFIQNVDFAKELNADRLQFTFATPYPGTQFHQWAVNNKYITETNWQHTDGLNVVMRNDSFLPFQLKLMHKYANLVCSKPLKGTLFNTFLNKFTELILKFFIRI